MTTPHEHWLRMAAENQELHARLDRLKEALQAITRCADTIRCDGFYTVPEDRMDHARLALVDERASEDQEGAEQ